MGCAHPYSEELDGASCVRRFNDSLSSAIRKRNRSLLRSSSMRKPRHPLPRVVQVVFLLKAPAKRHAFFEKVKNKG